MPIEPDEEQQLQFDKEGLHEQKFNKGMRYLGWTMLIIFLLEVGVIVLLNWL